MASVSESPPRPGRRTLSQCRRLQLLLVATAPPRKVRTAESPNSPTNASNLRQQLRSVTTACIEDLVDRVFGSLWHNHVTGSAEFRKVPSLRPHTPAYGKFLSPVYDSTELLMPQDAAYRVHHQLIQRFAGSGAHFFANWDSDPDVNALQEQLENSKLLQYCRRVLAPQLPPCQELSSDFEFASALRRLWFVPLRGCCAYNHVIVGEMDDRPTGRVSGLHNWFRLLLAEEADLARVTDCRFFTPETGLLGISFEMRRQASDKWTHSKVLSSMLVGVPIDFDLLLLSVVALLLPNHKMVIRINENNEIMVRGIYNNKQNALVTAFITDINYNACEMQDTVQDTVQDCVQDTV